MKKLFLLAALLLPALGSAQNVYQRWHINHAPAAAAQATISRAAATGQRHVATSVTVCVSAAATAQTPLQFSLRDGATGAGTVAWTVRLSAPANSTYCVTAPVEILGTSNTAMTLESAGVTVAGAFATVSLSGYTLF